MCRVSDSTCYRRLRPILNYQLSFSNMNTSHWWQNAWAALIFFTRLPFWRVYQPPGSSYRAVVEWWPLTGWLTGGATAAALYGAAQLWSLPVAVVLALVVRVMLTGALHEDGLADFFDGFGGGGNDRTRILAIMKDSRIGTYGVLSLLAYHALLFVALASMPLTLGVWTLAAAAPFARMVAGQLVQMLPYARTAHEAKALVVYRKPPFAATLMLAVQGLLPLVPLLYFCGRQLHWEYLVFAPCLAMYILYRLIAARLQGYTGDCCGAVCLLVELTFVITAAAG